MALRDLLIKLKVVADSAQLNAVDKKLNTAKHSAEGLLGSLGDLKNAFLGFGAVVAAQQIGKFVNDTVEAASAVYDQANALGISTDALQTWGVFLGQAGATTDDLQGSIRILSGNMQTVAATGKGPAADAFKKLGVEVKNSDGSLRDITEVMLEAGGALAMMKNPAERAALATDTLGRGAAKLLPAFEGGTEAARKQLAALKEIAVVYDQQFVKAADEAGDSLALLKVRFLGIRAQMVQGILPALKIVADWLGKAADKIIKLGKETTLFRTIGIALGALLGGALFTSLGGFGGILTKITGLLRFAARAFMRLILPALILDDVITGLQGGDSVFRDLLNALFGEAGAEQLIADLNSLIKAILPALGAALKFLLPIARDLFEGFGAFVKIFIEGPLKSLADLFGIFFADTEAERDHFTAEFLKDSQIIGEVFDAVFRDIGQVFVDVWSGIQSFALGVWDSIASYFQTNFVTPVMAALDAIDLFWENLGNSIVASMLGAFDRVKAGVGSVVSALNPFSSGSPVPAPAAPAGALGGSRATTLTDQRVVNVNVGGNAAPGETGRAVAGAVSNVLTRDRRASLAAIGGT